MAADIGATLFVDLLGMTGYPGSPFTGNIYQDLIKFLIVPTIFIIFVLYIATGRIIPDKKMRIMLGVGAYLFIIVSGYYSAFALLSGPYFIFLIFILGLLGFIVGHFRRGGHGGGGGEGHFSRHDYGGDSGHRGGGGFAESAYADEVEKAGNFDFRTRRKIQNRITRLEKEIEHEEKVILRAESSTGKDVDKTIADAQAEIRKTRRAITTLKETLDRDPTK